MDTAFITLDRDKIENKIQRSFYDSYHFSKKIKTNPYIVRREEELYSKIPIMVNDYNKKKYLCITQELHIMKNGQKLSVHADDVNCNEYFEGILEKHTIENTRISITDTIDNTKVHRPPLDPEPEKKSLINDTIAFKVDSLIDNFMIRHNKDIASESYYDYVWLSEKIFDDCIKKELNDSISHENGKRHLFCFLTRFLGNAEQNFYDRTPINYWQLEEEDIHDIRPPIRKQDLDPKNNENYTLTIINASKKKYFIDSTKTKKDSLSFLHWLTLKDNKLYDIFLTYEASKYQNDLQKPLQNIFKDSLGNKIYWDIIRFFFGFTTALTIQDIKWIEQYYHGMAIRNFFPGVSNSELSKRVIASSNSAIAKRYEQLFNKGYEVYVTLNKGINYRGASTVWIYGTPFREQSLTTICLDTVMSKKIRNLPALMLKFKCDQEWITIWRSDQVTSLKDKATVEFVLLCLNMNCLHNWIKKGNYEDELTVFTITSYLQDLWNDMSYPDKKYLKEDFNKLNAYMFKNDSLLKQLPSFSINEDIYSNNPRRYFRRHKAIIDSLCSSTRFKKIAENFDKFLNDPLQKRIHSKRFLFNVCYLKILNQYTYDNKTKKITADPKNESIIYRTLKNRILKNRSGF